MHHGLVRTNGRAWYGDSGGLVYNANVHGAPGFAIASGIVVYSDGWRMPDPGANMIFSRQDFINRELGLTVLPHQPPSPPLQVRFHFDNQTVTLPVTNGRINQSHVPIPAIRYGQVGRPGQAHMGWFTQIFPNMHYLNNQNRATPVNLASNFTSNMADAHGIINLYASWLMYGDVNGDDIIHPTDRAVLQALLLGMLPISGINRAAADVNVDNIIDPTDRSMLANHILGAPVILGPISRNTPRTAFIVSYHFDSGVIDIPITNGRIDTTLITEAELLAWEMELLNTLYTASRRGGATGLTMYITELINAETSVHEADLSVMVTSTTDILHEMHILEEEIRTLAARDVATYSANNN